MTLGSSTMDMNSVAPGLYMVRSDVSHAPFGSNAQVLCYKEPGSNPYWGFQFAVSENGEVRIRVYWNYTWKSWKTVTMT